jgi:DNA polymerase-1
VAFDPKKINPAKTLYLIDGSSFLYRAYYSLKPMHTADGRPVQAVYGFCRMIKKLIDTVKPEHMVLVWDSKGKTARHERYPAYKATRQAAPSDLFGQKEQIMQFADMIGLKQLAQEGVEADDLLYSLAKDAAAQGLLVVMLTADKDMGQSLAENVVLYDTFTDAYVTTESFEAAKGFPVAKLPFYFALLGDASDNIPGVKGIGKKGALDLVQQFDSLDHLYARLGTVNPRFKKLLEPSRDDAFLSYDLFLLRYYTVGLTLSDLVFNPAGWDNARQLFKELNFKSMLVEKESTPESREKKYTAWDKYDFRTITTIEALEALCVDLRAAGLFAFDTETDGVKPLQNRLVGISVCYKEGLSFYIPCAHKVETPHLAVNDVIRLMLPVFEDEQIKKVAQNTKFDQLVLFNAGIMVRGVIFDTMIAARLVAKEWEKASLKFLSLHYFDEAMLNYEDMVESAGYKDFSEVPLDRATLYSAADSHQTFKLYHLLAKKLEEEKLAKLFTTLEQPLTQVLFAMEAEGIHFDTSALKELDVQVSIQLAQLEDAIALYADKNRGEINLNSPRQIERLLFTTLGLPPQKKSSKGSGYSTDQEVLRALIDKHPVPGLLLSYRELFKLKSTYIDSLPTFVNPKTGKIHTTFSQIAVATGRLSSYDPNLQNIPVSGLGLEVRAAFKPNEGCVLLSADYSQIELRVLAQLSRDPVLTQAFVKGHDIHAETASRLFDVPLDQVSHTQRQVGKRINFSILYGLTPYGLSQDLGISFSDAKKYIDRYFEQYPKVLSWMEHIVEETKRLGYVKTLGGRRRYIPAIHEKNRSLYEEARRIAINTVAQGTAAELMKLGMLVLDKTLKKQGLGAKILLQIHDELVLSVPVQELDKTEKLVHEVLEGIVQWTVPLVVTMRHGVNWKEVSK